MNTTINYSELTNKELIAAITEFGGTVSKKANKATLVAMATDLAAKSKASAKKTEKAAKSTRQAVDVEALKSTLEASGLSVVLKPRTGKADCYTIRLYDGKACQALLEIGKYGARTYIHSASALYTNPTVSALFVSSAVLTGAFDRSATLTAEQLTVLRLPEPKKVADNTEEKKEA